MDGWTEVFEGDSFAEAHSREPKNREGTIRKTDRLAVRKIDGLMVSNGGRSSDRPDLVRHLDQRWPTGG